MEGVRSTFNGTFFKPQTFQTLAAEASLFLNILCFTLLGSKLTRKWHEMDDFAAKGLYRARRPFDSSKPNGNKGSGGFCAEQIQSHLGEIEVITIKRTENQWLNTLLAGIDPTKPKFQTRSCLSNQRSGNQYA